MTRKVELDAELIEEYTRLFNDCRLSARHETAVRRLTDRISANDARYRSLSAVTGVPWFVIAAIHNMEASLSFDR